MLDVNPTLLIGLGGSGKETLLRIRQRFFEAGFAEQPAWISYLWIDTAVEAEKDRNITQKHGEEQPFDHVATRTVLTENEMCDIGMTAAEIDAFRDPEVCERYKNIIDANVLAALRHGGLLDAKPTPALARLALFTHAEMVCKKIGAALHRLAQSTVIANIEAALSCGAMPRPANGELFEVYNECQAFIVGSFAGAAGSGICADVAAMLKSARGLFQFDTRVAVWGHFLLPRAFVRTPRNKRDTGADAFRLSENAGAALQNIERLSSGKSALKASWLHPERPEHAPDVSAPLFDSIALYDGFSPSGAHFTHAAESFTLVAHVLYGETRIKPSHIPGLPVYGWVASRHALLGLHPEARFAAIGFARITCEVPRLRLMAALTIAQKALQAWMGEPIPRFKLDPKVPQTRTEALSEALRECIESRLEQEFSQFVTKGRARWRDVLPAESPCSDLQALRQSKAVTDDPEFFRKYLALADAWPVEWKPEALGERLLSYYFTGAVPRVSRLFRALVDSPPLEGWDYSSVDDTYERPGGLWALDYALDLSLEGNRKTVVETAISKCVSRLTKKTLALARHNTQAREKLVIMVDDYANVLDSHMRAKTQFFARSATRNKLAAEKLERYFELQRALVTWLENVEKQKVCEALMCGYEAMLRQSPKIAAVLNSWRKRVRTIRNLLLKLQQNPDATRANGEYGLAQILAQFRALKPDASTLQLRLDVQQDARLLDTEILAAYDNSAPALNDDVLAIQGGMLAAWRDLLFNLGGDNRALPRKALNYLVDLPKFEAFERLPFAKQIDALTRLGLAQKGSRDVLKNAHVGDAFPEIKQALDNLETMSQCRVELKTPRAGRSIESISDADLADVREHVMLVAPAGIPPLKSMQGAESNDPHEALCFRYEYFVPLNAIASAPVSKA